MLTRRQVLASVAAVPLLPTVSEARFVEEHHALATESVRGYRAIAWRSGWIIAPGIRHMTAETCASLLRHVRSGAWLLLESGLCFDPHQQAERQLLILKQGLGLNIQPRVEAHSYISYSWPVKTMLRPFQAALPVVCGEHEAIAHLQGLPVCMKKSMGAGGIIYLGSMLGPGLVAEERESLAVIRNIIELSK